MPSERSTTTVSHVLVTELMPPLMEPLMQRHELHRWWEVTDREAFFRDVGPSISAVVAGPQGVVDAAMLDGLPNVELVSKVGAGYDLIDTRTAAARGVVVTNTAGVPSAEVADFAMGLLIATIRRIPAAAAFLAEGQWGQGSYFDFTETLRGRRIGILGLGKIGNGVARRCAGFDLEVSYSGRRPTPDVPYRYFPSVLELATHVDTLVITIAGGDETRGLIGADVLEALGRRGIIINVARASVIDEGALVAALTEGRIAGAGLDVFEGEPARPDALLALPNTVVTPHIAAGSLDTIMEMCEHVIANLDSWFRGDGPLSAVPETPWTPRS